MSISSDSAEQIVRISLEGMEEGVKVVAKITGVAAKNIAVALYAIMKDQKKTKGKIRLNNMLKAEKDFKIFSIKKEDLKTFYQEAKGYGILYCALISRKNKNIDGMVDIMVRAGDAPKVNRIVERYNLCTFDRASIQSEIEQEKVTNKEQHDISDNMPDIGEENIKVDEAMIEDIFAKPIPKEGQENQNPEAAKTEKNPPSERSSMSKSNSEGVTKTANKPSVKKELEKAKAEQKVELELKKAQKPKDTMTIEIPKTVDIPTIQNKERGK